MRKVSVVIPNYNGKELLEKNLPSVMRARENSENSIFEVIVVDDGSQDDSAEFVKKMFPEVRLIKHTINRGVSAAINTGARSAKGDLICLINTDVSPRSNFLTSTLNIFKDKKVFAVSLHEEGYWWARGFFRDGFVGHQPGALSNKPHPTFWVSGGSGVFVRHIWMSLGGMDEKLFSPFYWEDLDICYRAVKRGYKLLWDPDALVLHKHESTVKKLQRRYVDRIRQRNQLLFIWKNITSPAFARRHIGGLFKRIIRHPGYLLIFLMAAFKIRQVLKARHKERKEAKVSDEAIFARFP